MRVCVCVCACVRVCVLVWVCVFACLRVCVFAGSNSAYQFRLCTPADPGLFRPSFPPPQRRRKIRRAPRGIAGKGRPDNLREKLRSQVCRVKSSSNYFECITVRQYRPNSPWPPCTQSGLAKSVTGHGNPKSSVYVGNAAIGKAQVANAPLSPLGRPRRGQKKRKFLEHAVKERVKTGRKTRRRRRRSRRKRIEGVPLEEHRPSGRMTN